MRDLNFAPSTACTADLNFAPNYPCNWRQSSISLQRLLPLFAAGIFRFHHLLSGWPDLANFRPSGGRLLWRGFLKIIKVAFKVTFKTYFPNCSLWETLPCNWEVRGHCMCKEMLVIPVNNVYPKRIIGKNGGPRRRRGTRGHWPKTSFSMVNVTALILTNSSGHSVLLSTQCSRIFQARISAACVKHRNPRSYARRSTFEKSDKFFQLILPLGTYFVKYVKRGFVDP
jgi:hypothetical protein